jgi:hypothetical protein
MEYIPFMVTGCGSFFTVSSFAGLLVRVLWAVNAFRYVSILSFSILLCFDGYGPGGDALF